MLRKGYRSLDRELSGEGRVCVDEGGGVVKWSLTVFGFVFGFCPAVENNVMWW